MGDVHNQQSILGLVWDSWISIIRIISFYGLALLEPAVKNGT